MKIAKLNEYQRDNLKRYGSVRIEGITYYEIAKADTIADIELLYSTAKKAFETKHSNYKAITGDEYFRRYIDLHYQKAGKKYVLLANDSLDIKI